MERRVLDFPGDTVDKNLSDKAENAGLIPGWEDPHAEEQLIPATTATESVP